MDDVSEPVSPEGKERQVHAGFAKLRGRGWEYFMQKYEIILGRNSKNSAVDIDLAKDGGGMNVSRQHAKIYYNFKDKRFEIEVLGKNGAYVDGQLKVPSDGPIPLASQSYVVIGDFPFYFLLPTKKVDKRRATEHNGDNAKAGQEEADPSDEANGAGDLDEENGEPEAGHLVAEPMLEDDNGQPTPGRKKPHHEREMGVKLEGGVRSGDGCEQQGGTGQARKKKGENKRVKLEGGELPQVSNGLAVGGSGPPTLREVPTKGVVKGERKGRSDHEAHGSAMPEGGGPIGVSNLLIHKIGGEETNVLSAKDEEGLERKAQRKKNGATQADEVALEAGGKRKRQTEEGASEQGGPSSSQKKTPKKKTDPPTEAGGAREGTPEPPFQGRTLRVVSPPRRKWPGDGDSQPAKSTPVSPTRSALKRAAAETAEGSSRKGVVRGGSGETGGVTRQGDEGEVLDAVADILREQEDPTAAVPLNKLFMLFSDRHHALYQRSKDLLSGAAEGDASEQVHRPWLALASFLKQHPQRFVVVSQAKGRLVSWYAALRQH